MQQAGWAGACQRRGWYVGVCEKKVKTRQREQKRERDLFNREDWGHIVFFFFFQERDDRWKEKLRKRSGKKRGYRS